MGRDPELQSKLFLHYLYALSFAAHTVFSYDSALDLRSIQEALICSGRTTDSATRSESRHGGGHRRRAPRKSHPRQYS